MDRLNVQGSNAFNADSRHLKQDNNTYPELFAIAEQARKCAGVARFKQLHTLKGHVESVVKLKGLDIVTIQQHYII
ncbi:hypothetical protein NL676_035729 [Syzygium grande]|nr:hypothetical protein NL676_035729 [Syzygium grande]